MPTEILTEKALEEIRFDLANTKPASSPMGLFRQHCEDLLSERVDLQSQLEQLRAENEALRKEVANSEKYQAQLLDSDSQVAAKLDFDWALRELADGWIQNNEREGPHGYYQNARRVLNAIFDDACDKCLDAIKSLRATPHGTAYNNAINDAIHKVDQVKPEKQ